LDGQQELQKYQSELRKAGGDVKLKIEPMDEVRYYISGGEKKMFPHFDSL
jgi:hypothetical protein